MANCNRMHSPATEHWCDFSDKKRLPCSTYSRYKTHPGLGRCGQLFEHPCVQLVFGECAKLVCQSGMFNFIVCVAIANNITSPGKFRRFELFHFAVVCRRRVVSIKAHYPLGSNSNSIGRDVSAFTELSHYRLNELKLPFDNILVAMTGKYYCA